MKNKEIKELENNYYIRNESLLQEELISFCNGKNLPIQFFSAKEIMKMSDFTQNQLLEENSTFRLYRGVMKSRSICVKKFHSSFQYVWMKGIIREIVVATQMSAYRYALMLLGCCLETEFPVLVYEYPDCGCLAHQIYKQESLPWKIRLRIGSEISYALAYLQNGFNRPVIHRNLSARDVFLDNDYVAKVTGFYMSVPIPEGKVHLMDAVVGTNGYSEPEYIRSGRLTVKTDVYLFGVLLLELLASRRFFSVRGPHLLDKARALHRNGRTVKVVNQETLREVEKNGQHQQLQQVLELVLRCSADKEDDRPNIVDVAIELEKILHSCN